MSISRCSTHCQVLPTEPCNIMQHINGSANCNPLHWCPQPQCSLKKRKRTHQQKSIIFRILSWMASLNHSWKTHCRRSELVPEAREDVFYTSILGPHWPLRLKCPVSGSFRKNLASVIRFGTLWRPKRFWLERVTWAFPELRGSILLGILRPIGPIMEWHERTSIGDLVSWSDLRSTTHKYRIEKCKPYCSWTHPVDIVSNALTCTQPGLQTTLFDWIHKKGAWIILWRSEGLKVSLAGGMLRQSSKPFTCELAGQ